MAKAKDEPKRGRPSVYTPEIAEEICRRLAEGEPLDTICLPAGMPSPATVRLWVVRDWHGFAAEYARAREAQAYKWADEINGIADDGTNDWMERNGADNPGWQANGEHIQRSRLRVDSRKWLLSKILPKTFGDKLDVNHSGEMTLRTQSDDELRTRLSALIGTAGSGIDPGGTEPPQIEAED